MKVNGGGRAGKGYVNGVVDKGLVQDGDVEDVIV